MKTVFFDRDGVLIRDPDDYRVNTIDEIELFDDSVSALKLLAEHDFQIVIITNQAGIEEGVLTEDDFWTIQSEVVNRLSESGVTILKTYMNGEMDSDHASKWRKPGPLMLQQAAKDFDLDISEIYMVGDNQSDIDAAHNAGCKGGILVKTATNKDVVSPNAAYTGQTLTDVVQYIIKQY